MIAIKIIQIIVWLFIIPFVLGKYLEQKEENTVFYSWCLGMLVQMGIFLVLAIPMVLLKCHFHVLRNSYFIIIMISTIMSFVLNTKKIKNIFKLPKIKISVFQVIAIILVVFQIFIKYQYAAINNDDSSFVVNSTQMIYTGRMYYDEDNVQLSARRALAPLSAYFAVLSQYTFTHVTILTHTVIPMVYMLWGNLVYYFLGKKLFKDNKDTPYIFLIFMTLANFYFFNMKGANAYYLKFTWFGRAVVGAIMIPFLWKVFLDIRDDKNDNIKNWLTILCITLSSCLCSEMAIAIVSIPIMILAFISSIREKKLEYILKSICCIIPCFIIAIIYLSIK